MPCPRGDAQHDVVQADAQRTATDLGRSKARPRGHAVRRAQDGQMTPEALHRGCALSLSVFSAWQSPHSLQSLHLPAKAAFPATWSTLGFKSWSTRCCKRLGAQRRGRPWPRRTAARAVQGQRRSLGPQYCAGLLMVTLGLAGHGRHASRRSSHQKQPRLHPRRHAYSWMAAGHALPWSPCAGSASSARPSPPPSTAAAPAARPGAVQ